MPILTLTTDLGTKDQYVAAIKGTVLSLSPGSTIIDISHQVPNYDYSKAAYLVKRSYFYFPEKTIHLIGAGPSSTDKYKYLAALYKNHYFIAMNSGVFSFIFDKELPDEMVILNENEKPELKTFSILGQPLQAAIKLLNGSRLSDLGEKTEQYRQQLYTEPYTTPDTIDGYVDHIDKFENIITDIHKDLFYTIGRNRSFSIAFKKYNLSKVSSHYEDEIQGEIIAFFNFQGYLEVAMNGGKAASLTNFTRGDKVKIIFRDATNS